MNFVVMVAAAANNTARKATPSIEPLRSFQKSSRALREFKEKRVKKYLAKYLNPDLSLNSTICNTKS